MACAQADHNQPPAPLLRLSFLVAVIFFSSTLVDSFLKPSLQLLSLQNSILLLPFPALDGSEESRSNAKSFGTLVTKCSGVRKGIVAQVQLALLGQLGMIDLELSRGVLGPGDLKAIGSKLRSLTARTLSLNTFSALVQTDLRLIRDQESHSSLGSSSMSHSSSSFSSSPKKPSDSPQSHNQPHAQPKLYQRILAELDAREARHGHDLVTLIPILASSSQVLRKSCADGLSNVTSWLESVNKTRWKRASKKEQDEEAQGLAEAKRLVAELERAIAEFRYSDTLGQTAESDLGQHDGKDSLARRARLLQPFARFFEQDGTLATSKLKDEYLYPPTDEPSSNTKTHRDAAPANTPFAARSLFLCFVFTSSLESYAEELLSFLKFAVLLREKRRGERRVWFPSGFGKIWRKLTEKGTGGDGAMDPLGGGGISTEGTKTTKSRSKSKKNKEKAAKKEKEKQLDDELDQESDEDQGETSFSFMSLFSQTSTAPCCLLGCSLTMAPFAQIPTRTLWIRMQAHPERLASGLARRLVTHCDGSRRRRGSLRFDMPSYRSVFGVSDSNLNLSRTRAQAFRQGNN